MESPWHPITPSGSHDAARRRSPAHDKLQTELLAHLRSRPIWSPPATVLHRSIEAERPFVRRGQIIAYADVVEILTFNLNSVCTVFEVKPEIETVFGVVRQAKNYLQLSKRLIEADIHSCVVVARCGDPAIAALKAEWPHVWSWGIRFEEGEGEQ